MKYGFKYCSNTSFRVVTATESAGYSVEEIKEIYKTHLENELEQVQTMSDEEFLNYFGVK
jgi:hypothetical protein